MIELLLVSVPLSILFFFAIITIGIIFSNKLEREDNQGTK